MLTVLQLIGAFVADLFKSRRRLEIENLRFRKLRRQIRTRSPHDGNRPPVRPHAVRLLQAATATGSRDPGAEASAQCAAAASVAPATAFALGRSCSVRLALSSLPLHP